MVNVLSSYLNYNDTLILYGRSSFNEWCGAQMSSCEIRN